MKKIVFILASVIALLFMMGFGFKSLVRHIYNRMDCERFNIDHIELRTHTDIPMTTEATCVCEDGVRESEFTLHPEVDLEDYAQKNKFIWSDSIYTKSGEDKATLYSYTLDTLNRQLKVHMMYVP